MPSNLYMGLRGTRFCFIPINKVSEKKIGWSNLSVILGIGDDRYVLKKL